MQFVLNILMTELDNASLYLYSMTSKGLNIKKELVKFVGKTFNLRSRNENDRNKLLQWLYSDSTNCKDVNGQCHRGIV